MSRRNIVQIDEDLCNGCGKCVSPCAEGAITLVGGKAKVLREELCDGAGFCLGVCPTGALTITERDARDFSELAVLQMAERPRVKPARVPDPECFMCGGDEHRSPLLPVRNAGRSEWICARCLPRLIHG